MLRGIRGKHHVLLLILQDFRWFDERNASFLPVESPIRVSGFRLRNPLSLLASLLLIRTEFAPVLFACD
jgi:hypothetical protein